jgi:tight adherence protein B
MGAADLIRPVVAPLSGLPPWLAAAAIVGVVVAVAVVLYLVFAGTAGAVRRAEPADGPSLADLAEPYLRAKRNPDGMDQSFERLAEGTQLGLDGETASGWVLFGAAAAALGTYLALFAFDFGELAALAAALLGGFAVFLVLVLLQNRRRRAIQEQLPDGLFQLSRSLRSGLNLPASLRETAPYTPTPLRGLFDRLGAALTLGESTRHAVGRVADSARVTEFDLFTEVLALHSERGGNLPAMLDRLAASVRDRNQFRGYFRSTTALARTAAYFVALAAPVAFVVYWVQDDQRLMMQTFLAMREGQLILLLAAVLWVIGLVWITVLLRRQDDY